MKPINKPGGDTDRARTLVGVLAQLAPLRAAIGGIATWVTALLAVVIAAAALPWLSGDDPAQRVFRSRFGERPATPEALDAVRRELDIADNPIAAVFTWVSRVARGDFGTSWVSGQPVADQVWPAWAVSVTLATYAAAATFILAAIIVAPSLYRAVKGTPVLTPTMTALNAALASIPTMVLAVVLVGIFAVRLRILPATGWAEPRDMVLPVLALAIPMSGILARIMSVAIASVSSEEWTRTWRANGCRTHRLAYAIAYRVVAIIVPQLFLIIAGTIGAAVLIEEIFAIPGLGRLALSASLANDVPVVQGTIALLVITGLLLGLAGTVIHRALLKPASGHGQGNVLTTTATGPVRLRFGWPSVVVLTTLVVVIVGGVMRSSDIAPDRAFMPPSWSAPLGTDALGRDMWARCAEGALLTIGAATLCTIVSLLVGAVAGLAAERASPGLADILNATPPVFVGIALAAVWDGGMGTAIIAVCAAAWIPIAIHARTLGAEIRSTGFYRAGLLSGGSWWWMLRRHLIPMALLPLLVHALVRLPHLALALTGLSFLGIGAPHDSPEWGKMLADGVIYLERAPWLTATPAVSLLLVGLIASILADPRRRA